MEMFLLLMALSADSTLPSSIPAEFQQAVISEKLGAEINPFEYEFKNEDGKTIRLSKIIKGIKPIILAFVYYECPNLCTLLLNGLTNSIRRLNWTVGKEFEIVTISIDPEESPKVAMEKKKNYLKEYARLDAKRGWHFLTGDEKNIGALARELGFGYYYDKKTDQFAHSSAIFILSPTGKLTRILYGIEFKPRDIKLSLLDASEGKVGTILDRFLLFCYHYDPDAKGYSLYAMKLVRAGGAVTLLLIFLFIFHLWRKERKPKIS